MPSREQMTPINAQRDEDRSNRRYYRGQVMQKRFRTEEQLWWREQMDANLAANDDDMSPILPFPAAPEDTDNDLTYEDRPYDPTRVFVGRARKDVTSRLLGRKGLHEGELPLAPESDAALQREIAAAMRLET